MEYSYQHMISRSDVTLIKPDFYPGQLAISLRETTVKGRFATGMTKNRRYPDEYQSRKSLPFNSFAQTYQHA